MKQPSSLLRLVKLSMCSLLPLRSASIAALCALVLSPCTHAQTDGTWNTNAAGNWSLTNNWLDGLVANGAGATANLTYNITAGRTVTNDTGVTLGILNIGDADGTHAYTLAGGAGSLSFSNNGSSAEINIVASGTTNTISAGFTINDNLSISNVTASSQLTLSGIIGGSKAITINAGSVQFGNASSTYSGGTILTNTGMLRLGGNNVLGTGTLTLGGGTLSVSGTSARSLTNAVNLAGTVQVSDSVGTGNITLSGVVGGSGTLNKFTTSTLVMTNANSFGGSIYVNEGTLSGTSGTDTSFGTAAIYLGNTSGTGNATVQFAGKTYGNAITVQAGSSNNTLTLIAGAGGTTTLTGGLTLNQAVTLDSTSGTLTFSTTGIAGSSTIYVTNSSGAPIPTSHRVNLNAASAGFTGGAVVLSNGTLRITTGAGLNSNNTVQVNSGGLLEVNTGTATIGGLNDNAGSGGTVSVVSSSRTLALAGSGNYSFGGVLQDNGASSLALTKSGTGVQSLSGSNTYTGTTTVSGGVLKLDSTNGLPGGIGATGGLSALMLDGGVIGLTAASGDFSRSIVGLTPGATDVGWKNNGSGGFAAFGSDRDVNFGGAGVSVTWNATGGVFGTNFILSDASADAMVTIVNPISFNGGVRTVTVNDGSAAVDAALGGALTGGGTLVKQGSGVLALTASNSTALFNIAAGTLQIGNGTDAGSIGSATTINNNGALVYNVGSGTRTNGAAISGNGTLTQNSSGGTLELTGTNTYSGTTTVGAGSLIINGNNSGATGSVSVASGATLGGSGTIGGATTISGIHSPGTSPGLQTFTNNLTYNDGSSVIWELAANTADPLARGASYDGINVGGTLDFNGTSTLNLVFNTGGSTVSWSDSLWTANQQWKLYSVTGSTTDFGSFQLAASNWADSGGALFNTALSGSSFNLSLSGNDILLNYAVPEPSTYAMLVLAGAGFGAHVLRRRRKG